MGFYDMRCAASGEALGPRSRTPQNIEELLATIERASTLNENDVTYRGEPLVHMLVIDDVYDAVIKLAHEGDEALAAADLATLVARVPRGGTCPAHLRHGHRRGEERLVDLGDLLRPEHGRPWISMSQGGAQWFCSAGDATRRVVRASPGIGIPAGIPIHYGTVSPSGKHVALVEQGADRRSARGSTACLTSGSAA